MYSQECLVGVCYQFSKLTWPQKVERREKLAEKVWKEGDLPSCASPLIKLLQISYKYGICSLPTGKTLENFWKTSGKFWCCPGVGHLCPIFKPHRGAFAAFPKQNDKYPINMQEGKAMLGIDRAINI